jgi:hypothetical protein
MLEMTQPSRFEKETNQCAGAASHVRLLSENPAVRFVYLKMDCRFFCEVFYEVF